jgi:hypothetical protein
MVYGRRLAMVNQRIRKKLNLFNKSGNLEVKNLITFDKKGQ